MINKVSNINIHYNLTLFLMWQTGSVKITLSLTLAKKYNGEIISVYFAQFYCSLDLGTEKPSIKNRIDVKYHLIDILY